MADSKSLGTDTDLMAIAARSKQMNDFIVDSMSRDTPAVQASEAEAARTKGKNEKPKVQDIEPKEWMIVHDTVLSSVGAGGTYIVRAGTRFTDLGMKRDLETVNAKYVPVG